MEQTEGKVKFIVNNAFYRPQSQIVRDLGILAATVYRLETGQLKVLDVMSGCGVRSLRYYVESEASFVHCNEGNPDLLPILKQNLSSYIPSNFYQISSHEANRIFFNCYNQKDYYDLVDVDCFGSANPYLNNMIWATKLNGLMYLTSTDGRSLTGLLPDNTLKNYGCYARHLPMGHEQALRILIGKVQQSAAEKGLSVEPIFSYFTGQNYRIMLRLIKGVVLTEKNYGFLAYCYNCGEYQLVNWRKLGKIICNCEQHQPYYNQNYSIVVSGPMWLGNLHQVNYLEKMQEIALKWQWEKVIKLLKLMEKEATLPPYFYPLKEISSRGKLDLPKRDLLIQELQNQGYETAISHVNLQSIKTNASFKKCVEIARLLSPH